MRFCIPFLSNNYMAKELPYFKFEPNQWENGNIQICNRESKGLFIDICSMYWSRLGDLPFKLAVQKLCGGDASAFNSLIKEEIFVLADDMVKIYFLDEQLLEFKKTSNQNSENAKKRWEKERKTKVNKNTKKNNATASKLQSENDTIRKDKIREEKNNILLSELFSSDESDHKKLILNFEIPEKDKQPAMIAYQFWLLIKSNLESNGISTSKHNKAIYNNWVPPVRLIMENEEATIDQLREIHQFLKTDLFWQKNIQSTKNLREHVQKLLLTIKNSQYENNTRNSKSSAEQRKAIAEKKNYKTTFD